jgi:hypothetical protein
LCVSCGDENDNVVAVRTTVNEIKKNPDYFWFDESYDSYSFYSKTVEKIKANFNNSVHKIVIFAGYDCLCGTEYLKFPYFVKILDSANISEENYEIFIMGNTEYANPYSHLFKANSLPAFVVFNKEQPIYSINDTLLKYKTQNNAPFNTLEEALLESLKTK